MRRRVALVVMLAACRGPKPEPQPTPAPSPSSLPLPSPSGTYRGRVLAQPMSYRGADWLDRPDRLAREQPDKVVASLALTAGMTVADIGAGSGYLTVRLARAVGATGTVYATDVQPEMLALLGTRIADEGLANVRPVLVTGSDSGLPAGSLDLALLVDVYHELAAPDAVMAGVRRALRPGGRLVLVEYRGEDPDVPIREEHKMTLPRIREELEPLGFTFVDSLEFLHDQRIVIFTPTQ